MIEKKGEQEKLGKQKKKCVRQKLGQENREGIAYRQSQGAQGIVVLLAQKARLQHQRGGEQKRQPEQAGSEPPRLVRGGIKREAEKHDHNQDENDGGGQEFP